MSEAPKKGGLDRWLYGGAAALAVVGALVALATRPEEPEAQRLDRLRGQDELAPAPRPRASSGPGGSGGSGGLGGLPAPDLPEVPILSARENTLAERPSRREGEGTESERQQSREAGAEVGAEMRLLQGARQNMLEQPAEALDLLEQHRRRHPQGFLREEREALAIEALARLRRDTEAERRYMEFLDDFPGSSLRAPIGELLRRLDRREALPPGELPREAPAEPPAEAPSELRD